MKKVEWGRITLSNKTYGIQIADRLVKKLKDHGYEAKAIKMDSPLIANVEVIHCINCVYSRKIHLICELGQDLESVSNSIVDATYNRNLYTECGCLGGHVGKNNRIDTVVQNMYYLFINLK